MMAILSVVANLIKGCAFFATCFLLSPVIVAAHFCRPVGEVYYWIMFSAVDFFHLRRQDRDLKEKLFQLLTDSAGPDGYIKALEIGPGAGVNFAYFPNRIKLTTLEQNAYFKKHCALIQSKYPTVEIEQMIIGNAENMDMIADETFDVVIGTHIFCCIRDNSAAAREIFRVLKPGGKFFFLDIVSFPKKRWFQRMITSLVAPFWYFFTLGCKAGSIDAAETLFQAGFDVSLMQSAELPEGQWSHSLYYYGTALKDE